MNNSIREQLEKIARLAESGVGGERETAKALLARLCEKHGVSPDSLLSEKLEYRKFVAKDKYEMDLLAQAIFHVTNASKLRWIEKGRCTRLVKLTDAQYIDTSACYEHYKERLAKHLNEAWEAFIHANRIYGSQDAESSSDDPIDLERMKRVFAMMRGTAASQWVKPVGYLN
jgi:hypothetical protein